ncbi:MAG: AmmeMemoRadiSam system protein B [Methanomassiliicoccales archaeon]
MRYPAVAGMFYSDDEEGLLREVERCFLSSLGPGEIPDLRKGERRIRGAVCPHAGLAASGPVAAHLFHALAQDGFPEAFIIIGPNHQGFGAAVSTTTQDFQTPLGVARVDRDLQGRLEKWVDDEPFTHQNEHSLEVILPFIQYFSRDVPFVPLLMSLQDYETARDLGAQIREAIGDRDVLVIASSDFSHYVPQKEAEEKDGKVIERILNLDPEGVYETVVQERVSTCGYGPVMAMLEAVQGSQARLIRYGTSGDVMPSREVVGYAAIIVE